MANYSPLDPWLDLNQILCIEESRVIGRDQTVSWQGKRYLIQDGNRTLYNYLAMFRTDLKGRTRVFVLEAEVEMSENDSKGNSLIRFSVKRKQL